MTSYIIENDKARPNIASTSVDKNPNNRSYSYSPIHEKVLKSFAALPAKKEVIGQCTISTNINVKSSVAMVGRGSNRSISRSPNHNRQNSIEIQNGLHLRQTNEISDSKYHKIRRGSVYT